MQNVLARWPCLANKHSQRAEGYFRLVTTRFFGHLQKKFYGVFGHRWFEIDPQGNT